MLSSLLPDHQSCNKLEVTLTDVFPLLQFHFLSSSVVIELLLQNHSSHEKNPPLGTVFANHLKCLIYISQRYKVQVFGVIFKHYPGLVGKNKSRNIMTLCHHLFF